tara:strand:- start:162 stop:428 length:267 start_codon:yes stop_codon:yes gene_type:complete
MISIITLGVTIVDNFVIGVMSLVSKSIPPKNGVAGSPAKVIMSIEQFKKKLIEKNFGTRNLDGTTKRRVLEELGIYSDSNKRIWKKTL